MSDPGHVGPRRPVRPIDALLRVAATAVAAPVVVACLDQGPGRQSLLGGHGIDRRAGGGPGPVLYSLSVDVIAAGLPIIVNDAAADPRVRPGPGLHDAEVAAFAGFPIRDDEQAVGAVCLVDRRPHAWTPRELDVGDQIAQLVSAVALNRRPWTGESPAAGGDAFLSALLDSLDTGVAACDAQGRLMLFNRALRDMVGAAPGMTEPGDWADRFIVNDLDGHPMPADAMPLAVALHGEPVRGLEHLVGPRQRHVLVNGHPIIGPDGTRLGAVAAVHDISLRRQAERLTECELQVSYALADAEDLATAGVAVLRIVGTTFGWSCGQVWLADDADDVLRCAASWRAGKHQCPQPLPAALWRGDGHAGLAWKTSTAVWEPAGTACGDAPGSALALPIRDADVTVGVLALAAGVAQDPSDPVVALLSGITAHLGQFLQRQHTMTLRRDLDASKNEYLGLIGHELRSPLTVISTYTELLTADLAGNEAGDGDLRQMLDAIGRSATTLRRTIDELIDMAALDAGHLVVHRVPEDLAAVVREAAGALRPEATGHVLTVDLPSEIVVLGDRERLRQVMDHLLRNAVIYSPGGGAVHVAADLTGTTVVITVTDDGIGVPAAEAEAVFHRFQRGSNVRHQGFPGAGLGLSLSRSIAEQHGGTVRIAPRGTTGSIATLTLPLPCGRTTS